MILFVDIEHRSARSQPWADFIMAARTRITYDLQDIAGETCLLQHYTDVDTGLVDRYDIRGVFLSGSSTDPDQYGDENLDEIRKMITSGQVPVFGFCGGYQLMMEAHGSTIERIGPLEPGDHKRDPDYMPGWRTETGYMPVKVGGDHPVLAGLGSEPVFRHYHGWEIKELPDGFANYASTDVSPHQLVINDRTRQVGTQFHPEYFTEEHPAGRRLIENFCRWIGVIS